MNYFVVVFGNVVPTIFTTWVFFFMSPNNIPMRLIPELKTDQERPQKCTMDRAYEFFLNELVSSSENLKVDELYAEMLLMLLHQQKFSDSTTQSEINKLVEHLQTVFRIEDDKHAKILAFVENKDNVPLVLNVEVMEARNLRGKNVHGTSDPSCTIFVSPLHKETTDEKHHTLNPVWQERFSLPISDVKEDLLYVEVWDHHDSAESVAETGSLKTRRLSLSEVRSGLKTFVRELAKNGKEKQEILGSLKLPLKNVPIEGINGWYPLESGFQMCGEIHLRLGLGMEKKKKLVVTEYQHLLALMLAYELVVEQHSDPYNWDGVFNNKLSKVILQTLEFQGGLSKKDIDLAQWFVYTNVHNGQHALNAKIFPPLLKAILEHLQSNMFNDLVEQLKLWQSAEHLVENFVTFFKNIHQHQRPFAAGYDPSFYVVDALKTLALLKSYLSENQHVGKEFKLKLSADWIVDQVQNAISFCSNKFFDCIVPHTGGLEKRSQVEQLVKAGERLILDLDKCLEVYQNDFKMMLGVDYFSISYLAYDKRFGGVVKPLIAKISSIPESQFPKEVDEEEFAMGTTLFNLYLKLKQFARLSSDAEIESASSQEFCIQGHFEKWFDDRVVFQWLRIAKGKALNGIKAAVVRDSLDPLDSSSKITSSAWDIARFLQKIEIWNQLPSAEMQSCQLYVEKILEDLGECALVYTDLMCEKVAQKEHGLYHILDELCFAINNIEKVADELKLVGVNIITAMLAILDKNSVGEQHQPKLELIGVMEQTSRNISEKVIEILEDAGLKMQPILRNMMEEAANSSCDVYFVKKLETYLGENLHKVSKKLSKPTAGKMFEIIWGNVSASIQNITSTNIENGREPKFFQELQKIVTIMNNFFHLEGCNGIDTEVCKISATEEIEKLLEIYGASTSELILSYFLERHKIQSEIGHKTASKYGYLEVRVQYCDDIKTLQIDLLNARNLMPGYSNGLRDTFIKVALVTNGPIPFTPLHKSKIKKKTLFPWFEETFSAPLTINPLEIFQGILIFSLKDHGLLGKNDYIGDSYLPVKSVPFANSHTEFKDLPEELLALNLPTNEELESRTFQALERRQSDKYAVEFVNRERTKFYSAVCPSSTRRNSFSQGIQNLRKSSISWLGKF